MSTRRETPQHETYEALRAEIARRHPRFSDRLQVIAEFALDHPTEIALGTVAEVAQRAKVQPSAIVRFARALGYGGFTEMQQVFRSRLVASVAPSYKERIAGLRRDGRFRDTNDPRAILARFASEGMVSLESLQDAVRERDLARAIALLGAAHTIYVLGLGGSFPVATHLTYVLRKLGRRVVLLDGLGSALGEQAVAASPQDALIAVSFRTYIPTRRVCFLSWSPAASRRYRSPTACSARSWRAPTSCLRSPTCRRRRSGPWWRRCAWRRA